MGILMICFEHKKYAFRIVLTQTSTKLTPRHSNPGETKTMEATTPELGPVRFWSPKSSSFSGSDSIVVEEAAKNVLSPGRV